MTATLKLDSFLPYRLSLASNRVSGTIADAYHAQFRLRVPEWRLICVLAEFGAMSQQALCSRTQMDKVTVSRAAIALHDRQIVTRTPNPDDQRSHLLDLSEAGWSLYRQIAPQALDFERRIFASLSEGEQASLRRMLERVERAAADIAREK